MNRFLLRSMMMACMFAMTAPKITLPDSSVIEFNGQITLKDSAKTVLEFSDGYNRAPGVFIIDPAMTERQVGNSDTYAQTIYLNIIGPDILLPADGVLTCSVMGESIECVVKAGLINSIVFTSDNPLFLRSATYNLKNKPNGYTMLR